MVFVAYLFPTKINPPQLIFLLILPHHCIQRVIKFSVDINHHIKIDVSSLRLGDHEACHENSCLLPATSYCSYDFTMYEEIGGLHKCFLAHAWPPLAWLIIFPRIQQAPFGMVQQFATLLGLARFPVPLPYVHDTWYPNGNNKKPNLVDILINFTFLV